MSKKPPRLRRRALQFETLEPREVMAAGITAALQGSVLTVVGTDDDDLYFRQSNKQISIAGVMGSWSASKVKSISINLGGGSDFVSLNSQANGGTQALKEKVTIASGGAGDQVRLAGGHDVYFAGAGQTLAVATNGKATLNGAAVNLTSKVQTSLKSGVLTITATNGNDNLNFRQSNGKISIFGVSGSWKVSKVTSIVVHLQNGNDNVSLHSLANGGNQALTAAVKIHSGAGNEKVRLANGNEVTFSGAGNTLVVSGGVAKLNGTVVGGVPPAPPTPPTPPPPPPPPTTDWFTANIQDAALRSLGSSLYVDGVIDRNDMLAIFQSAQDGSVVDATELADLKKIVSNTTLFGSFDYVWQLSSYVVNGNAANAAYQGQAMGNLAAGSSATHLSKLVNKWYLGLDRPTAAGTYREVAGSLFVGGVAYTDVRQGSVGDCYLLASLAEAAVRDASLITSMFIVNGDGTYTVKFHNGNQTHYVTVDSYLPTNAAGQLIYASRYLHYGNAGNELWVALAEKAYVQLHEMGWVRPGLSGNGQNSYAAINGGYIASALSHITGRYSTWRATDVDANPNSNVGNYNFNTFVTAYTAGSLIGFASFSTPLSSSVVGSHAYAVIGYNAATQTIKLYNPWGVQSGSYQMELTLNWAQIQQNFHYFDYTV